MFFILIDVETTSYYVRKTNSWQSEMHGATVFSLLAMLEAIDRFQMFDEFNIYAIYCHWLTRKEIDQLQREEGKLS